MKIYLACPYSHHVKAVRNDRFRIACRKAAELMQQGHIVFSPISHSHPIADYIENHTDHNFWMNQDLHFLEWCDELWILDIDDGAWMLSDGVKTEKNFAERLGKPVKMVT